LPGEEQFSIEQLKKINWPNMTCIVTPIKFNKEWLEVFEQACPNLILLDYSTQTIFDGNGLDKGVMLEFLKDEKHWPNLRHYNCGFANELNNIRPFVTGSCIYHDLHNRKKEEITPEQFVREWLDSDIIDYFWDNHYHQTNEMITWKRRNYGLFA